MDAGQMQKFKLVKGVLVEGIGMVGKAKFARLDHIEYVVRDVNQFVEFLKMFGFEIIRQTEHHHGSAEMKLPGENQPIIEIHGVEGEENPGINHIAFSTDDPDAAAAILKQKGEGRN